MPSITTASLDHTSGELQIGVGGVSFLGVHLTIDMWDAQGIDDIDAISDALRDAADACDATLLELTLHRFDPQGCTGIAVLSESHIAIHSWPEVGYAAIDIFTCGKARPHEAIPVLRKAFQPKRMQIGEQKRGLTVQ